MSSVRLPLFHVLYTNAPGEDGVGGFRFLAVGFGGMAEDRRPIDEWLRSLEPVAGSRQGWAATSFRVAGVRCAALAVVDPSFAVDESGRDAALAHAFMIPLEEGRPIGHFGRALYERAWSFLAESRASTRALATYLEGCRLHCDIEIPEIQSKDLDSHELLPVVQALIDAAKENISELVLPGILDEEALLERIIAASAALPPCLRLALRWRVGLQPGWEGFVVRPGRAGESPSTGRLGMGQEYVDDLWRRLREGRADELARIVTENWDIKEWKPLPAPPLSPPPPRRRRVLVEPTGREEALGNSKSANAPALRQAGKSAADYDREYQSLYKDVRSYIDLRFQNLAPPPPPVQEVEAREGSWAQRMFYWRPELYLLLVLLVVATMYYKLQNPPAPEVLGTLIPSSTTPMSNRERQNEAANDPVAQWKSFIEEQPLVAGSWLRAVAAQEGLESQQVSSLVRNRFADWTRRLESDKSLSDEEINQSRIGLFEYVHARWVRDRKVSSPGKYRIDLRPDEMAPHLGQIAEELGLASQIGSKSHPEDPNVQAAVVLRWIERHPRS